MTAHRRLFRSVHTVLLALFTLPLAGQETQRSFLCIADLASGFRFDDTRKEWIAANFNVTDSRYVVRPLREDDLGDFLIVTNHKYGVWRIGEDEAVASCKEGVSDYSWLSCEGFATTFLMNSRSLRFQYTHEGGYLSATLRLGERDGTKEDEGGDTPAIEIGKCSVL